MLISFFEEFPDKNNIEKLKIVKGKTNLFLAARSLKEFYEVKKNVKDKSKVERWVYWPILEKKEGYWISPFSRRQALLRIFKELEGENEAVMLDLELPTTKNIWLYAFQCLNFGLNKRLIKEFIDNYKGDIYLAEYYPESAGQETILRMLGLHYNSKKVKVVKMMYHSLHPFKESFVKKQLKQGVKEWGDNYMAAYGTIAKGISGTEKILSAKQLERDLNLATQVRIKEVIIFRLGGLNKEYARIIGKFS
ncbi:hypothetical protein HYX11_02895 [Candidatus Woesearchaeota archaeon]|nr:hypothetical protein [Candidatus Woesearchaeota archaeon]